MPKLAYICDAQAVIAEPERRCRQREPAGRVRAGPAGCHRYRSLLRPAARRRTGQRQGRRGSTRSHCCRRQQRQTPRPCQVLCCQQLRRFARMPSGSEAEHRTIRNRSDRTAIRTVDLDEDHGTAASVAARIFARYGRASDHERRYREPQPRTFVSGVCVDPAVLGQPVWRPIRNHSKGGDLVTDVASVPDSVQNKPAPGLSARLVGVLLSPRETFAAVAAKPRWLGVMLVTMVMSSAAYYVILSSQDMQDAIVDQQVTGDRVARRHGLRRAVGQHGAIHRLPPGRLRGRHIHPGSALRRRNRGNRDRDLHDLDGRQRDVQAGLRRDEPRRLHPGDLRPVHRRDAGGRRANRSACVRPAPISVSFSRCWRRHRFSR